MWLYNACRRTLASGGLTVKPDAVTATDDQEVAAILAADLDTDPAVSYVIKTHRPMSAQGDGVLGVTMLRDPRDMAVSFRGFAGAVSRDSPYPQLVRNLIETYKRIEALWGDKILTLRYDDIAARPAAMVAEIRAALRLPPDPDGDAAVAESLSPESVRALIARVKAEGVAAGVLGRMDAETGFRPGHVSDMATGKWRRTMTPAAQTQIVKMYGPWLRRHGFPLE